jgi:hypothetical protein
MTPPALDLKPIVQKQLAIFYALQWLGFEPHELSISFPPTGGLFTEINQDGRTWHISVLSGPAARFLGGTEYMRLWSEWSKRWNEEFSPEKRGEIFRSVFSVARLAGLEAALRARGFRVQRLGDIEDLWTAGAAGVRPS